MKMPVRTIGLSGTTTFFTILAAKDAGTLILGSKKSRIMNGDIILCRENILWKSSCEVESFAFEEDFFDPLFYSQITECRIIHDFMKQENPSDEHLFFHAAHNEDAQMILHMIEKEAESPDVHSIKMMHLLPVALVTCLDRHRQDELIVSESTMVADNRFGRIMKYIGDHYTDCTLQQVARQFGYNPNYLSQRFQIITGETFSRKLLMIRLDQAQRLLSSTDLSIEQISSAVGFRDKSYLIRKFREVYGKTPGLWRKEHAAH